MWSKQHGFDVSLTGLWGGSGGDPIDAGPGGDNRSPIRASQFSLYKQQGSGGPVNPTAHFQTIPSRSRGAKFNRLGDHDQRASVLGSGPLRHFQKTRHSAGLSPQGDAGLIGGGWGQWHNRNSRRALRLRLAQRIRFGQAHKKTGGRCSDRPISSDARRPLVGGLEPARGGREASDPAGPIKISAQQAVR